MPPRYPAIALRGPAAPSTPRVGAPPTPPTRDDINNLSAQPDEEGYGAQLALLAADKRRFLDAGHPIKDALNIALQQPAGVLLKRYAATLRAFQAAQTAPLDSDDPTERPMSEDLDQRPAIIAFAETQVAKALLGDLQAAALIADRVEGKAGQRRGDIDAETEAQRMRMRLTITQLVSDMVERTSGRQARVTESVDVEVIADE